MDANLLICAVLGRRVREVIETRFGAASFFFPETAFAEAERYVQALVARRGTMRKFCAPFSDG